MRRMLLLPMLCLFASPASGHIVSSRLGDFYGGVSHPLTGLSDLVLWLALGLLAGLQPSRAVRWIVVLFPLGLLLGFAAGLAWGWTDDPMRVDAGLMMALGLLTAAAWRLPATVLLAVAFGLAVFRGAANASGIEPGTDATLFAAGLAAGGYAVLTLLIALVEAFRRSGSGWQAIAVRAGGSWIAAIGLMAVGATLAM